MGDNDNNGNNAANANLARHLAKQPLIFTIKQNFPTWFKQFRNFCDLCQVPDDTRYRTLLSFLDQDCFVLVEGLNLTPAEKADIQENAVYNRIKTALRSPTSKIPPEVQLKYRKQMADETIESFATCLENLALDAFPGQDNIRANGTLIRTYHLPLPAASATCTRITKMPWP